MPRSAWPSSLASRLRASRSNRFLFPARVLSAPRVQVDEADASRVRLHGVVCSVCARRTRDALQSLPGVESVRVDLARSEATVTYAEGARPDEAVLQRALERVVVGQGIRRWIERTTARMRRSR